jgi:glycosyltransferase involved in cell wall biosynthesis
MKIAMIAPPWIPVPPPRYGGIESMVALLTDRLVKLGNEVVLFCSPASQSQAEMRHPLPHAYTAKIGQALYETDHVLQALNQIKWERDPFDVVHDHTATAVAWAQHCSVPLVHTMHNGHEGDRGDFYLRHGSYARLIAISYAQRKTAPRDLLVDDVIHNPIDVEEWPYREQKMPFALWAGRFDPVKGAHLAIRAAKVAGMRLVLAGPIQQGQQAYFDREVRPHLKMGKIDYVGEIGGNRKKALFANASCLLMPIEWNEPFGMVMVEALACGTPVIAFPYGAATEIVVDGLNGYQVADVASMAEAMTDIQISPAECRESVEARYDAATIAENYCAAYERAKVRR